MEKELEFALNIKNPMQNEDFALLLVSEVHYATEIHKSALQTSRPSGCFIHLHTTGLIIFTRSGHHL